jgi:hypothetical protein
MVTFFTMTMLQALGYYRPDGLIEDPRDDGATAFEIEYAYHVGYHVGANGEWIADNRSSGNVIDLRRAK